MTTMGLTGRVRALRMHPLAMGLAAVCAASVSFANTATARQADLRELASRFPQVIVPPAPTRPATAVTNCDDAGPGSLRDTVEAAVDGDTVDLSGLSCSRISLTTGAIVFGANNLAIDGPGENKLMIDGALSGAVLYHLGSGTLVVNDLSIGYGFKYRSDNTVTGSCVHTQGNALLTNVRVTTCSRSSRSSTTRSSRKVSAPMRCARARCLRSAAGSNSRGTRGVAGIVPRLPAGSRPGCVGHSAASRKRPG